MRSHFVRPFIENMKMQMTIEAKEISQSPVGATIAT